MKQFLRILFGLPLCPFPMLLATYAWMWSDDEEGWMESIGLMTWHLASGQWEKLPD